MKQSNMVKFLDIYNQDKKIINLIFSDIKKIIKKNNFILGEEVTNFEKNFAKYCNSKYSIGCANGTDALFIALKSLNLPKKSEVILPAMTYCSTAFAIINAGLKPILVDIDKYTPTININEIKKKITKNTKVIMPVHLYGSVVNIKKIRSLIGKKKIYIIDDCAQAHGAKLDDKRVGSLSDISCFSLYPGKNLGAYGDAGIITTNNKKIFTKMKNYRNLGSEKKFIHTQIGINSRLDTLQAAILNRKLDLLDSNNLKRIKIAKFYNENISNKKIIKINYSKHAVYHQYVICVKDRKKLAKIFDKNNIQYGYHYPKSINQIDSLKNIFRNKKYKNSEFIAKHGISLPIDPNLSKKDLIKVVDKLNSF